MMHDCVEGNIRDQLPEFVHGVLSPSVEARVRGHVESCEECAAEVRLIEQAAALFVTPSVNVSAIVAAIPAPRRRARYWGWAAAASVLLLGGFAVAKWQIAAPEVTSTVASGAATAATPDAVTKLANAVKETTAAGRRLPTAPKTRPAVSFGGGLSDLTDAQLNALLLEIDGIDAAPSADPAIRAPAVDESTARARRGGGPDGK